MSAFLFGRWSRRIPANDIRPGNRYRRQLGRYLAATATVLDLRSDLVGIPHVHISITVDGSVRILSEGDTRVLALQSSLETSRASRTGSPTRSKSRRQCDGGSAIAETSGSNLIMVGLGSRACPRRRLRHDKRSGLHLSDQMTRVP